MNGAGVELTGQGAFVVGAGGAIGHATALLLAECGATVACVDHDEEAAAATATAIEQAGGTAVAQRADVTDEASLARAFAASVEGAGQIHVVVNCVGIQGPLGRRSHEVELEQLDATYAVNLRGAFALSRVVLPHLLEHRYGRVAHVASIAGKEGNPNMIGYSITKAGLIGMVKAQGKEYALDGITVNAVAPGVVQTPFLDSQPREVVDYMTERIPMRRACTTTEVAQMLAWMVSPACAFTTGFTFDLSGGRATY